MAKKEIKELIFQKTFEHQPIKFKEIDIELEPDDIIISGHDEGYYSENNSWDPHYYLQIFRYRLETDKEEERRLSEEKFFKENLRKRRYENYLKLKKEFENEDV